MSSSASLSSMGTPASVDMSTLGQAATSNATIASTAGAKNMSLAKIDAVSKDFEAQFLSQMLGSMFSTVDPKNSFGGSETEETWRSLMVNEYGKTISRAGGIGIAAQIKREMLKLQEVK